MTTNAELVEVARRVHMENYKPAPIVLTRGKGTRVEDVEGRSYLDFCAGIAVCSIGHGHPVLAAAIAEQAARLMHVSNLFYNDRAIELAETLCARTGFSRVFFCNSGAEANEAMLKLARRFHYDRGDKERVEIVSTLNSFHGRTMFALTATGQTKYHEGMAPMVGGVSHVSYGDLDALRAAVSAKTAAIILEPIQAEGGILVPSAEYLRGARAIADERGALLLFDEVQTGYGRTGKMLAREHSGVEPDACSLAKGIAGGFPLGAMLIHDKVRKALPPGSHATTFGGNPLACAAGLAVLRVFDAEKVIDNAAAMGEHLGARLDALAEMHSKVIKEARGRGLLRGVMLRDGVDPQAMLAKARAEGLLLSIAGGTVLRATPPLNVSRAEIDEAVGALDAALRAP